MKSPDVRFLAWSIFALTMSLPATAWLWSARSPQPLPITARPVPALPTPRYQMATQDHYVYRIDTQTGAVQCFAGAQLGWVNLDKDDMTVPSSGVAVKNK